MLYINLFVIRCVYEPHIQVLHGLLRQDNERAHGWRIARDLEKFWVPFQVDFNLNDDTYCSALSSQLTTISQTSNKHFQYKKKKERKNIKLKNWTG